MSELGTQGELESRLAGAGFPAAREEARALVEAAGGDPAVWHDWARRRLQGEPLEWILGWTVFCGLRIAVDPGVYVPRPQTELLVRRAIDALPSDGTAVDLCSGSGAIAAVLGHARPGARVVATEIDPDACRCAAGNGVEVYCGDLADAVPAELVGTVDVVVAVVPYVPTDEIEFLPQDVRRYEPHLALDGGVDGLELLVRAVLAGAELLRPGGSLLLELGGTQDEGLGADLRGAGYRLVERIVDEEGDLRGVHVRYLPSGGRPTSNP